MATLQSSRREGLNGKGLRCVTYEQNASLPITLPSLRPYYSRVNLQTQTNKHCRSHFGFMTLNFALIWTHKMALPNTPSPFPTKLKSLHNGTFSVLWILLCAICCGPQRRRRYISRWILWPHNRHNQLLKVFVHRSSSQGRSALLDSSYCRSIEWTKSTLFTRVSNNLDVTLRIV
jgi:hypothetical protein